MSEQTVRGRVLGVLSVVVDIVNGTPTDSDILQWRGRFRPTDMVTVALEVVHFLDPRWHKERGPMPIARGAALEAVIREVVETTPGLCDLLTVSDGVIRYREEVPDALRSEAEQYVRRYQIPSPIKVRRH